MDTVIVHQTCEQLVRRLEGAGEPAWSELHAVYLELAVIPDEFPINYTGADVIIRS